MERRDKETLMLIIQRWTAPGSIIVLDCWKPYDEVRKLDYIHKEANHSAEFVNKGFHTNEIE